MERPLLLVDRLESRASQDFLGDLGFFDPTAEIRWLQAILEQKLRTSASEQPSLYEALPEYYLVKTEYDAAREKERED